MSFHHGHHHHSPTPRHSSYSSSSSCCCCCSCKSSEPTVPISSPVTSNSDQLLQSLLLLLQSSQSQPPIFLNRQPTRNRNFTNIRPHHHQSKHEDNDNDPSLLLLHSLIHRVAALESSLSSLSPPQIQQQQQRRTSSPPAKRNESLKHLAAATIQRCFRRFLARRSKTLRDLKRLASIKSHVASIRSSLSSHKPIGNPRALSRKAMDLLFHLDSIQSSDPMIREGKRSVSKELVRISEFVDKILVREKEEEDEVVRVRDSGRRVSFAGVNGGDDRKVFDDLSEIMSEEEETETRSSGQPEGSCDRWSNVDEGPRVANGHSRGPPNGGLGLAAPLPVKMETRSNGYMKRMTDEEEEE